jgi:hypothetical protein
MRLRLRSWKGRRPASQRPCLPRHGAAGRPRRPVDRPGGNGRRQRVRPGRQARREENCRSGNNECSAPSWATPPVSPAYQQIVQTWRYRQYMPSSISDLRRKSSLQNARFLLQICPPCKVAPRSRQSVAFPAHRHPLDAIARKKNALARGEMSRVEREVATNLPLFRHWALMPNASP